MAEHPFEGCHVLFYTRLSDALLRAVADQGYTIPTPIQLQAIPPCWRAAIS